MVSLFVLLSACSANQPRMEPLTNSELETAERQWAANGSSSYHLVVRVNAARMSAVVYDVVARNGKIAAIKRDGQTIQPEGAEDYSISGLFRLLQQELRLMDRSPSGTPVALAEMFARFDPETGRLERYRRSTGQSSGTLKIEVLKYEPQPGD